MSKFFHPTVTQDFLTVTIPLSADMNSKDAAGQQERFLHHLFHRLPRLKMKPQVLPRLSAFGFSLPIALAGIAIFALAPASQHKSPGFTDTIIANMLK
jgi:hypothetical protein